jgi:hypothetical protein
VEAIAAILGLNHDARANLALKKHHEMTVVEFKVIASHVICDVECELSPFVEKDLGL